jgi:hypothetical protein
MDGHRTSPPGRAGRGPRGSMPDPIPSRRGAVSPSTRRRARPTLTARSWPHPPARLEGSTAAGREAIISLEWATPNAYRGDALDQQVRGRLARLLQAFGRRRALNAQPPPVAPDGSSAMAPDGCQIDGRRRGDRADPPPGGGRPPPDRSSPCPGRGGAGSNASQESSRPAPNSRKRDESFM